MAGQALHCYAESKALSPCFIVCVLFVHVDMEGKLMR